MNVTHIAHATKHENKKKAKTKQRKKAKYTFGFPNSHRIYTCVDAWVLNELKDLENKTKYKE